MHSELGIFFSKDCILGISEISVAVTEEISFCWRFLYTRKK